MKLVWVACLVIAALVAAFALCVMGVIAYEIVETIFRGIWDKDEE